MKKNIFFRHKENNQGFTLIEVLATIAIIAVLGLIAIPNVLSAINKGKDTSYSILVQDIKTASVELYEELEYAKTTIYRYDVSTGKTTTKVVISANQITLNLQTLVSNGLLTGTANNNVIPSNKNKKIILNPKTKEDMGDCQITIKKTVTANKVTYTYQGNTDSSLCPTTVELGE